MRLLDLYCGAGGAAVGYHNAGFEIVGCDIKQQKNYPFEFHQMDAFKFLKEYYSEFDAIHASPPCQAYSSTVNMVPENKTKYPKDIKKLRSYLQSTKKPYIIENVPGAPLQNHVILSGPMFGLGVIRTRHFEIKPNLLILTPDKKKEGTVINGDYCTVAGEGCDGTSRIGVWRKDWMCKSELRQAIPPAYTKFIGKILIRRLKGWG
ncbi:DNA cytosine methyltransferase [Desulfococcaceae bacterium HSG7]|nr:DNA cytosine methyltransferase [Desulfococcaceae bacterium HSG7]